MNLKCAIFSPTVGRCESLLVGRQLSRRRFSDLPAQDDARHGLSGFIQKLFHPEQDSFYFQPDSKTLFTTGYSTAKGYQPIVERGPHGCAVTGEKATLNKSGRVAPSQTPINNGGKRGFCLILSAPLSVLMGVLIEA